MNSRKAAVTNICPFKYIMKYKLNINKTLVKNRYCEEKELQKNLCDEDPERFYQESLK